MLGHRGVPDFIFFNKDVNNFQYLKNNVVVTKETTMTSVILCSRKELSLDIDKQPVILSSHIT